MADHAERLRQVPGGEGVGGKALVHQGQGRLETLVLQVQVIAADLVGQQHALVGDGVRRHGGHIVVGDLIAFLADLGVHALADDEQPALEFVLVGAAAAAHEYLADHRLGGQHAGAQVAVVHRHIAPAEHLLAVFPDVAVDDGLHQGPVVRPPGQEYVADAVPARGRQLEIHHGTEEFVRDLNHDARAVTGLGIGANRPAMAQALQDIQAVLHDFVALAVLDVGDEADAAGIALVGWIVEPLPVR